MKPVPLQVEHVLFETCERRLVMSAQLLFDVLGDQALELHQNPPIPISIPTESITLEPHLQKITDVAWGLAQVRQQFGLTGAGQTVAVIDSGIAWDHVALGKGFGPGYRVVGGWDFTEENDSNPYDDGPAGFHGTHVSGIIGSDDPTHLGVAPGADLVALRVFNDAGSGQLAWVENALRWVHQNQHSFANPITTVNLSLGTQWNSQSIPSWAMLEDEFQQLANDGILVTASAGNSFKSYNTPGLSYPAASPYVLPVASVDDNGQLSDFSQRSQRVLAAPGSNIVSTVPDHVFGRDGKINDYAAASGTSMAAPYVAGASVLVRQAMEMTGWESINATSITNFLHSTADSIFDAATGTHYDRINLESAIKAIIPTDTIGDNLATAAAFNIHASSVDGWINHLSDTDAYRFVADASGTLSIDANSDWLDSVHWSLRKSGQEIGTGNLAPTSVNLVAGQSYELYVSADGSIGSFSLGLAFAGTSSPTPSPPSPPAASLSDLGAIRYFESSLNAGASYAMTAAQDGFFSVQWNNPDAASGSLVVTDAAGRSYSDATWSNGELRVDLQVKAGERLTVGVPGHASDQGDLVLANVLQQSGSHLLLRGTDGQDRMTLDVSQGVRLGFGSLEYSFAAGQINDLVVDGAGNNDRMDIRGSALSDKVDLRPGNSTFENTNLHVAMASVEEITYQGGGGADRVYLYDSDKDDTLTARPHQAVLLGVGYRFEVQEVDRIYVHATGGGQDFAYLYDSAGNDRLSVRPQFTSLSGDGFFNYIRGFERVYAYADAGGFDTANLYDSSGDDRFITSGVSASIVGPGFSSFTRGFEMVNAYADAGGNDLATLYGANGQTQWQQASDFISFRETGWFREARGFEQVETYVANQLHTVGRQSLAIAEAYGPMPPMVGEAVAFPITSPGLPIANHEFIENANADWAILDAPQSMPLEFEILRDTISLSEMLASKLYLPEEPLLNDPELEQNVLDEAFRQFEGQF